MAFFDPPPYNPYYPQWIDPRWAQPARTWTSGGMVGTVTQTHNCPTWRAALAYAGGLRNVDGKPSIKRFGNSWRVTWKPRMYLFNSAVA